MAIQKVFKVTQAIGEQALSRYFTQESMANISAEVFGLANANARTYSVSTVELDTATVNLEAFLKAGGILVGSGTIS